MSWPESVHSLNLFAVRVLCHVKGEDFCFPFCDKVSGFRNINATYLMMMAAMKHINIKKRPNVIGLQPRVLEPDSHCVLLTAAYMPCSIQCIIAYIS